MFSAQVVEALGVVLPLALANSRKQRWDIVHCGVVGAGCPVPQYPCWCLHAEQRGNAAGGTPPCSQRGKAKGPRQSLLYACCAGKPELPSGC